MRLSHRTQDLPRLSGAASWIRDLRYHEASRQVLAAVLILVYMLTVAHSGLALVAAGVSIAVLGLLFRLYASGFINKNSELATNGPYALVRHPLYTGNILALLGFAIANGQIWSLPLALAFFWFYYPPAITYEDRKLQGLFGSAWERWAASRHALLPSFRNLNKLGGGQWSIRQSFVDNGEILIALYAVICLVLMARRALIFPG